MTAVTSLRRLVSAGMPVKLAAHAVGMKYNTALPYARGYRPNRLDPPVKTCIVCGGRIEPKSSERPHRWRRRKACSNRCCGALKGRANA